MRDVIKTTELMMQDAKNSLQQAIKAKDTHKAQVAHALLAAAQKKLSLAKSQTHQRKDLVRRILAKARASRRNTDSVVTTQTTAGSSVQIARKRKHAVPDSKKTVDAKKPRCLSTTLKPAAGETD